MIVGGKTCDGHVDGIAVWHKKRHGSGAQLMSRLLFGVCSRRSRPQLTGQQEPQKSAKAQREPQESAEALQNWRQLIHRQRRINRLRKLGAVLGHHLRELKHGR